MIIDVGSEEGSDGEADVWDAVYQLPALTYEYTLNKTIQHFLTISFHPAGPGRQCGHRGQLTRQQSGLESIIGSLLD